MKWLRVLLVFTSGYVISAIKTQPKEDTKFCGGGDWVHMNGNCYYYSKWKSQVSHAQKDCVSMGAELVFFLNHEENNFVLEKVVKNLEKTWIGLSIKNESTAFWDTMPERPLLYSNWLFEPREDLDKNKCVLMLTSGYWEQENCFAYIPFVCKKVAVVAKVTPNLRPIIITVIPVCLCSSFLLFIFLLLRKSKREVEAVHRRIALSDKMHLMLAKKTKEISIEHDMALLNQTPFKNPKVRVKAFKNTQQSVEHPSSFIPKSPRKNKQENNHLHNNGSILSGTNPEKCRVYVNDIPLEDFNQLSIKQKDNKPVFFVHDESSFGMQAHDTFYKDAEDEKINEIQELREDDESYLAYDFSDEDLQNYMYESNDKNGITITDKRRNTNVLKESILSLKSYTNNAYEKDEQVDSGVSSSGLDTRSSLKKNKIASVTDSESNSKIDSLIPSSLVERIKNNIFKNSNQEAFKGQGEVACYCEEITDGDFVNIYI